MSTVKWFTWRLCLNLLQCNRGLKEDCEVVTEILEQQTGLLKTSGVSRFQALFDLFQE